MATKKGGKKGTAMNLTEFTGDKNAGTTGESMAWAEDDWEDEAQQEQALHAANAAKLFNRKAGAMDDFRSAAIEQLATVVPLDMVAPFVAHLGNLPNSITVEQFEDTFAEEFTILAVDVIKRPKATFGYIEVATREELQKLILQSGRNVGGRKIRSDVATEQQIERFKSQGKDPFTALSRDAIGAETQPDFRQGGMGGGRGMGGGMGGMRQPGPSMGEFSRDDMGDKQEGGGGGFGGGGGGGFGGFGSAEDLGDFRSGAAVAQPPAPGMGEGRGGGRSWGRGRNGGGEGNSKPSSPNVQAPPAEPADFSHWRDAPVQAQPQQPSGEERKGREGGGAGGRGDGEKKGGGGGAWGKKGGDKKESASPVTKDAPGGGWRRDAPEKQPEGEKAAAAADAAPKVEKKPAWGGKKTIQPKPANTSQPAPVENNRFATLRK